MEEDDRGSGSDVTYEEDALGVPDHTTSEPERESEPPDRRMPPAEKPRGVDAWGTTAAEQRAGEPLGERLAAEEPDRPPRDIEDALRLTDDDGGPDETGELTSTSSDDRETPTAEEAAVHVRDDVPGGTSTPDSYVDVDAESMEPPVGGSSSGAGGSP